MSHRPSTCILDGCNAPLTQAATGRPRLYCSEAHRQAGRNRRDAEARRLANERSAEKWRHLREEPSRYAELVGHLLARLRAKPQPSDTPRP
ncbi:MAG: hypothetical protein AAGA99_21895 [Actinomycetota bacterium]